MTAGLFDTHCHLDHRKLAPDLEGVLERAKEAGVTRMATIGCASSVENVRSALNVAKRHPDKLVATCGVHPHDAVAYDDAMEAELRSVGADAQIVAIGEMGLDYHYEHSPREVQRECFRRQIALAKELGKPIIIHTRTAPEETLEILDSEGARDVGGIIHCFSENPAFAKRALDMNFVAAFSGIVTFKRSTEIQEAAKQQPLDSILVETDAPYLAPVPFRGKRNEPSYVAHTAKFIADLRGISVEALHEATTQNAMRVFGLS